MSVGDSKPIHAVLAQLILLVFSYLTYERHRTRRATNNNCKFNSITYNNLFITCPKVLQINLAYRTRGQDRYRYKGINKYYVQT